MRFTMLGSNLQPGPVTLSDDYSKVVGNAKQGVAASQKALYDVYNSLTNYKITSESISANSTAPYGWSYSKTYSGYKAIAYSLVSSSSGGIIWNAQAVSGLGTKTFSCSGFANTPVSNGKVVVTWIKS